MAFLHRTLMHKRREQLIGMGSVSCTLAEFQKLFPGYQLPEPYVDREYEPGMKHLLKDEDGAMKFDSVPWSEGDFYLAHAPEIAFVLDCLRQPAKKTGDQLEKARVLTETLRKLGV